MLHAELVLGRQGTNAPGTGADFTFTTPGTNAGLSVLFGAQPSTNYSYLYLKQNGTPTETDFDFVSRSDVFTNRICLESPEFDAAVTNYGLRVFTPATSGTHAFMVAISMKGTDRAVTRPAWKPVSFATTGILTNLASGSWHFFQVDVPNALPVWRLTLNAMNGVNTGLYVSRNQPPATNSFLKAATTFTITTNQFPAILEFTNAEAVAGTYFIGVRLPDGAVTNAMYSLVGETGMVPLNDECGLAIAITAANYTNTESTLAASSVGDPPADCVDEFGGGVWYRFTAPSNGRLTVDTRGSDFDTGLAIYTGDCGVMTQAACNDDADLGDADDLTSEVTLAVTAVTTYHILAGGYEGDRGNHLAFRLAFTPEAAPPQIVPASVAIRDGRFSMSISGEPGARLEVWASTNLVDWWPTSTLTNSLGTIPFEEAVSNQMRFYRVRLVP
jgi:hypothetical protein